MDIFMNALMLSNVCICVLDVKCTRVHVYFRAGGADPEGS